MLVPESGLRWERGLGAGLVVTQPASDAQYLSVQHIVSITVIAWDDGSMEWQQMRYVLAVAETKSFTRAAEQCFVVQSSLSQQIKSLEQELGVKLFARTSRRVELTEAGAAFLPAARAALKAADRAAQDAAAAGGQVCGHLKIGTIPTLTAVELPEILGMYCREYPEVTVSLYTASSDELTRAVADGDADVAFLGLPAGAPPPGTEHRLLSREHLLAVLPADHRLADQARLSLQELAGETFADFPSGTSGRAQSDTAFAAAGLHRRVAFEAMDTALILDLVREGLAIALLPPGTVIEATDLTARLVSDGPERCEYLTWHTFNPTPASAAFVELALGGPG